MTMSGPERAIAGQGTAGRTCPYCRFPIKEGGEIAVCGVCHAPHHVDCWSDNSGCAVIACAGGPGKAEAAIPATEPLNVAFPAPTVKQPVAASAPRVLIPQVVQPPAPLAPSEPPKRRLSLGAAIVLLAVVIAAVGAAVLLLTQRNQRATPPVAQVVRTVTEQSTTVTQQPSGTPGPIAPSGCNCRVQDLPVQCGSGLATTDGVYCNFANNAFYEYWRASGADPSLSEPISVWSPTYSVYIPLNCGPGNGVVDCFGPRGIDVRFTQADVTVYSRALARGYAASGNLGPNG